MLETKAALRERLAEAEKQLAEAKSENEARCESFDDTMNDLWALIDPDGEPDTWTGPDHVVRCVTSLVQIKDARIAAITFQNTDLERFVREVAVMRLGCSETDPHFDYIAYTYAAIDRLTDRAEAAEATLRLHSRPGARRTSGSIITKGVTA
ncbi:MAG: hypothetical protein ABIY70_18230 [Capsulimonas sp.]|uniref:hypothetical protein n=1 Tax=Capsulimonas sp. TaxID=2494211 RepID=UPI003264C37F